MKQVVKQYPDKILRTKTTNIEDPQHHRCGKIINKLFMAAKLANGIGMAAQQVGETGSIFLFNGEIAINPQILSRSVDIDNQLESCLSIDKVVAVPRNTSIKVSYHNRSGNPVERDLEGYEARVFQHEYDHLHGKLIIDYQEEQINADNRV